MSCGLSKNSVSLIGNTTKDAEMKEVKESGNLYGDYHLAVQDHQQATHYFPVRCILPRT
jgi:hypothetical protein